MCGQIGRRGTMEAEEIYMNQARMQAAAAFKDKQRGAPANKGVDDPDYENITLTFRNQNQSKGSHSPPKNQVPVRSRPSLDSTRTPRWLYGATISLYILLALFCIILLAWVLMKHSEMSGELLGLKMDLLNVSISARECQEGRRDIQQCLNEVNTIKKTVRTENEKLSPAINQIKTQLQDISKMLQKMSNELSTPQ
ncbi:mast cell-expressed membrane protein 1 isoform X1 [Rousettus aegyptiacus]|uniref:mast cell-expressed membrane protein 1 isoform X1 n=1 Tax=Rousettus aegyptiacus TaxID=9407 RepID=UPI00168D1040|nr:mast cell-expressed membrane protein 1 isoform X1 [Rousettus aegyptiacus]